MNWQKYFWSALGMGATVGSGLLYYAAKIEPEKLWVTSPTLPRPIPVKTVFFSDVHLGRKYHPKHLEAIVNAINAQSPQLVLFGGDFFAKLPKDFHVLDFGWMEQQLKKIHAPLGKFAVLGNHDVRYGSKPFFYRLFEKSGFTVLWDEVVQVNEQISICGLSPYSNGRAMVQLPDDGYRICLCHMPDKARYLSLRRCDVMLSGHSHDGQVHLPILTKMILPPGGKMYPYGLYHPQGKEKATLFVSRGIGTSGPPLRMGSAPEVVVFQP